MWQESQLVVNWLIKYKKEVYKKKVKAELKY